MKSSHIDFAWHSDTPESYLLNELEVYIDELVMRLSGFESLEHSEKFWHKKYRLRLSVEKVEDC